MHCEIRIEEFVASLREDARDLTLPTNDKRALLALPLILSLFSICARAEEPTSHQSGAAGVVEKVEESIERGARAAASGIERGVRAAASGVERGAKAAASGVERGVRAAASGVQRGAKATADAADTVAKKVGASSASEPTK